VQESEQRDGDQAPQLVTGRRRYSQRKVVPLITGGQQYELRARRARICRWVLSSDSTLYGVQTGVRCTAGCARRVVRAWKVVTAPAHRSSCSRPPHGRTVMGRASCHVAALEAGRRFGKQASLAGGGARTLPAVDLGAARLVIRDTYL